MTRRNTMFDIDELHPNLECEACDDYDHCLPRWEDDGGGTARLPLLARAFEEGIERDHVHPDKPPAGERRYDPGRGSDGGQRGGGAPDGSPFQAHEPRYRGRGPGESGK